MSESANINCDHSWLPSHYRMSIEPWLDSQFQGISHRLGNIVDAKRAVDDAIQQVDVAFDTYSTLYSLDTKNLF